MEWPTSPGRVVKPILAMDQEIAYGAEAPAMADMVVLSVEGSGLLRRTRTAMESVMEENTRSRGGNAQRDVLGAAAQPALALHMQMDLSATLGPFLEQQGVEIIREMTSAISSWEQYLPPWAKTCILSELSGATPLDIRPQKAEGTSSMAKDVARFRAGVIHKRTATSWTPCAPSPSSSIPSTTWPVATLTVAKAFCMLAGERYRSHNGALFEYMNGSWRTTQAMGYSAAENILHVSMVAKAFFVCMAMFEPPRTLDNFIFEAGCVCVCAQNVRAAQVDAHAAVRPEEARPWDLVADACIHALLHAPQGLSGTAFVGCGREVPPLGLGGCA